MTLKSSIQSRRKHLTLSPVFQSQFPSLTFSPVADYLESFVLSSDPSYSLGILPNFVTDPAFLHPLNPFSAPSPNSNPLPFLCDSPQLKKYVVVLPGTPSGYICQRSNSSLYHATHSHNILLRSREGNRNQGTENPPNKDKTRYQYHKHPKIRCLDTSPETQSILISMPSSEPSNPTTLDPEKHNIPET